MVIKIRIISIVLISLLLKTIGTQAQLPPKMQKMSKKELQQLEKDNPEIKKIIEQMKKDPSMKKQLELMGIDDSESGSDSLATSARSNDGINEIKNEGNKQRIQNYYPIPVLNPTHHTGKIPLLMTSGISTLAQNILKHTTMDILLKKKLDDMAKDSTLNIAGTGTLYLSLGLSTDACGYLIAKGILKHPKDPYAANSLGVYYRDKHKLEQALQCFLYADKLLPAPKKSPYIYTNIGWASFYYGDFITAEKYFDKALSISNSFVPAMEGQATLAYTRGDTKTLFACLAKELLAMTKTAGGGGGGAAISSGPSPGFASVCGGAFSIADEEDQESNQSKSQSSPFDNIGDANNSSEQDPLPPPGTDISHPKLFKPVFINDILEGVGDAITNVNTAQESANKAIESLINKQKALNPRYTGSSYIDEHGNFVHDRDYTNFLNLHGLIILQFESKVAKDIKTFKKFSSDFNTKVSNRYTDLVEKHDKALQTCIESNDGNCAQTVWCNTVKQFHTEGNNFLEIGAEEWEKMYDKVVGDINWFLKNDAFFVSRVHDVECNKDMNYDREIEASTAVLEAYECWKDVLGPLVGFNYYAAQKVKCPPVKTVGVAPDPFTKAPKHIKEFEDKRYCKDINFPLGILGSITENCHTTTITLGLKVGFVQLGITYSTNIDPLTGKVKDPIYSENNGFDHSIGVNAGIAYKLTQVIEFDANLGGSLTYDSKGKRTGANTTADVGGVLDWGALGKIGTKASRTWQMDGDWKITGYSDNRTMSGNLGGNLEKENSDPNQTSRGFALSGEYSVTSNYDANGNYIGGNKSKKLSLQGSATNNSGNANSEVSGQNNFFGIQSNQVIQVTAGQEVVSPWSGPDIN